MQQLNRYVWPAFGIVKCAWLSTELNCLWVCAIYRRIISSCCVVCEMICWRLIVESVWKHKEGAVQDSRRRRQWSDAHVFQPCEGGLAVETRFVPLCPCSFHKWIWFLSLSGCCRSIRSVRVACCACASACSVDTWKQMCAHHALLSENCTSVHTVMLPLYVGGSESRDFNPLPLVMLVM